MKKLLFIACCLALIANISAALAQNFISVQTSSVHVDSNSDDMRNSSTFSQQSNYSSGYQTSSVSLSATDLRQPHILRISTSGSQLSGDVLLNGKVVKRLSSSQVEINLSPLLSAGEHIVEISGRYAPASSGVSVELSGPGISSSQQTSGNGLLHYTLNLSVR
ncbi:hypothetical protein [Fischerella thermalis]|jgi:hypothetical protein|uniref:Uncharacterized protein n=1 Tax=Fischerella thermalis JSC-11 TaxID=741277 RepID=G6FNW9_9CYAN|nr:hypothetical protein [Fischerella thermalis]PLZ80426.1 hypothetical protein CBP16_13355 [Fischerella thermalis WC217]PMB09276.1 hypothetical protein CEN49_07010 [Fischerella thermalis CCMEE 5273]RDH50116.1 hypothetical protein CBF18_13275 [Mastigocladus laminosus WC112]EHC18569.1 hypothetical protein FJSC11DRAFT_0549 [Fischerella thermalis JSC-11]PLZ05602.1 hypothetical protein CBP18_20310 [Fischerella thermalis WC119]